MDVMRMPASPAPLDLPTAYRLAHEVVAEVGETFRYVNAYGGVVDDAAYAPFPFYAELSVRTETDIIAIDTHYDMTQYVAGLDPADPRLTHGCIVGKVLDRHGATAHRTLRYATMPVMDLHRGKPGLMVEQAAMYLAVLQNAGDDGHEFGDVLRAGDTWLTADTVRLLDKARAGMANV